MGWEVAKDVVFFVYYIYCTTLLMDGRVKKKKKLFLHDQTVYIYTVDSRCLELG